MSADQLWKDRLRRTPGERIFIGPEGLRPIWGILLFLGVCEAIQVALYLMLSKLRAPSLQGFGQIAPQSLFVLEGVTAFSVLASSWVLSKLEHRPLGSYGFTGPRSLLNFATGLAWGVGMLSFLVLMLRQTGLLVFGGRLLGGWAIFHYAALWSAGFLLVGLTEESLFRGYLLFTFARGLTNVLLRFKAPASEVLGFWGAATVLSIGFGLIHTSNKGESPIGLIAAGLIGMAFCYSVWRTGSLWWAIGFHAAWDWSESFLYGVADSGTRVQGHLFATSPAGPTMYSGGPTGPEGSLLVFPVVLLIVVVLYVTAPNRNPTLATRTSAP